MTDVQSGTCELGTRVAWYGEEGVVVHTAPLIMRTIAVHSYVPISDAEYEILGPDEGRHWTIPSPVLARIRRYVGWSDDRSTGV